MGRLTHAPVYFAIIQVRFNTLMALDSYVPKIQDRFRRHGFPDAQTGQMALFNLTVVNPASAEPPRVPVAQVTRYNFSNMEKTSGFILDQNSLSLQTTDYDTFAPLLGAFVEGLGFVHDEVHLNYTDRIGVRYLDAVYPAVGSAVSDYLEESVLGLCGRLDGKLVHAFSETYVQSDAIHVIARTVTQNGPVAFPPDLQPWGLTVPDRFQNLQGEHAILDTDGSYTGRLPFALDKVKAILEDAHSSVTKAFRATITDHALEVWR